MVTGHVPQHLPPLPPPPPLLPPPLLPPPPHPPTAISHQRGDDWFLPGCCSAHIQGRTSPPPFISIPSVFFFSHSSTHSLLLHPSFLTLHLGSEKKKIFGCFIFQLLNDHRSGLLIVAPIFLFLSRPKNFDDKFIISSFNRSYYLCFVLYFMSSILYFHLCKATVSVLKGALTNEMYYYYDYYY